MLPKLPSIYLLWFKWLDPLICTWTVYMNLFTQDMVLNTFVPNATRNPAHDTLFHQMAGNFAALAILSAALPRMTQDLRLWKLLQFSIFVVDLFGLYTVWWNLSTQGRLELGAWRGDDWGTVLLTVAATVIRGAFLAEVGFGGRVKRA